VKNIVMVVIGVVLLLIGAVWTLQGLGYLTGSAMTGNRFWAVVGPIVGIVGLVFTVQGGSRRRRDRSDSD